MFLPERAAYGLSAPTTRVIEFSGLEIPLLALPDQEHVVVLGNRRAAALKSMRHFDQVPLYVARNAQELELWCQADRRLADGDAAGYDARPWTWSERAAVLDHAMKVIGRTSGAYRGSVIDILAAYFGVHEVHLRNAVYLLRFERAGGPEAERAARLMALVDRGEIRPQTAYRKLRDGDPVALAGGNTPGPAMPARQQENALRNTVSALSGVVMGLRQMGDISPDVSAEVRDQVVPHIQDARRVLARIARQLQGVSEPVDESNKGARA